MTRPTHIRILGPDGGSTLIALSLSEDRPSCVIGRDPDADVVIDNPSVSERQCRVWLDGGQVLIEGLDPQWATFVNGTTVTAPTVLGDGDHVDFGDVTLEVIVREAEPAAVAEPRRVPSHSVSDSSVRHKAATGSRGGGRKSHGSGSSGRRIAETQPPPPLSRSESTDLDENLLRRVREAGAAIGIVTDADMRDLADIIMALDDDLSGPDTKHPEIWYTLTNTAQPVESRLRRAKSQVERVLSRRKQVSEEAVAPARESPEASAEAKPCDAGSLSVAPRGSPVEAEATSPSPRMGGGATVDAAPPDLEGFEIHEEIGRGGMGTVYRARNVQLDIDVAIKVMRSLDSGADRLLKEARAAARLQHPHIVQVLQFERVGTTGYYVMQLVRGLDGHRAIDRLRGEAPETMSPDSLSRRIRVEPHAACAEFRAAFSHPTPYFAALASWIAGAADGLHHAHRAGLVHRDIKPSNVIIAPDGRMMVMDFGLAVPAHAAGETGEGRVGTPRYLAPERVADWAAKSGLSENDPRADIWSLGATMYELLTFRPAYQGTEEVVLRAITTVEPPKPTSLAWSIPPELERICLKAMRRVPEERYAHASDMAADLRTWLAASPSRIEPRLPRSAMDWLRFVAPWREK